MHPKVCCSPRRHVLREALLKITAVILGCSVLACVSVASAGTLNVSSIFTKGVGTLTITDAKYANLAIKVEHELANGWIIAELDKGRDVEVRLGWNGSGTNGHMIDVVGGGYILGTPWIAWVHDANQGQKGGISWNDGGIGFSPVIGNWIVAYIGGRADPATIDYAVSEAKK